MKKIDLKTIAGVGAGVAIGHFAFKSKSPLVLMAFGLGGGILSYHLLKRKTDKVAEIQKAETDYIEQVKQDIEATLESRNNEESSIIGEKIKFNPTVEYSTPEGTVNENSPTEFMDIGF